MDCIKNVFLAPQEYLKEFYNSNIFSHKIVNQMIKEFRGLSMMCVWLTKLCPLRCDKCFFRSNMDHDGMIEEEYNFTDQGLSNLINFINESNSGYLMLSGGGDPMVCVDQVVRIIRETKTRRIVIVTSGFFANTKESANRYIGKLYQAYKGRFSSEPCEVVLRLSIDCYHEKELQGNSHYKNIIEIFHETYSDISGFTLMIHTMRGDTSITELAQQIGGQLIYGAEGESDNSSVIKIVPQKGNICIGGYNIPIGISKLFLSDLMIDLTPPYSNTVIEAVQVMNDDMENSEQDNPSYIQNALGPKGLDFWVDYNGNVTTWFNQDWNHLFNLYTDNYETVVHDTFSNPMTALFLRKGYAYRNHIVEEVNPLALKRAQAINLRDYFAAFLLEEDKTKLYYGIRVLQSFLAEFLITENDLDVLSPELKAAVLFSVSELKAMYDASDYDILLQYLDETRFDKQYWDDLFMLIALGHYEVSEKSLRSKLEYYAEQTDQDYRDIKSFIKTYDSSLYMRLHRRISFMKPEALNYCLHKAVTKEEKEE